MKENYLGLQMPGDAGLPPDYLRRLAKLIEQHIDLAALLQVCIVDARGLRCGINMLALLS